MKIFTIGTQGKAAEAFFSALLENGIQKILDIRLRNSSQLLGYAKGKDLAYIAGRGFGISYDHVVGLAPTAELLDGYTDKDSSYRNDWEWYESEFDKLLTRRPTMETFEAAADGLERIVLLCSEASADQCHRRLVAEYVARRKPCISVIHL